MRLPPMAVALSVAALAATPMVSGAQQAERVILTGTVLSKTQTSVPGAVVAIPALQLTALTNDAGNFRLTIPAPPADRRVSVVVSSIGYRTVETTVTLTGAATRYDVRMDEEAIPLDEVVVTGTAGRQERRAQAATIATVDAQKLAQVAPISSVTQMLQARTPGIVLRQNSGSAGTASTIRIRGQASISLDNDPLVFIDGVRMDSRDRQIYGVGNQQGSRLNDLRLDEIESIEIVKGPAAATLYGADGSAGVIQIITKRGRAQGGFTQSISMELGFAEPNFTPPSNWGTCSAANVADPLRTLCHQQPAGAVVQDNPLVRESSFREATIANIDWNLRGGGETYGVFFSLGRDFENGTLPNNEYEKLSGMLNFDWYTSSKLRIDAGFRVGRTLTQLPRNDNDIYGYLGGGLLGSPTTVGTAQDGWFAGNRQTNAIKSYENFDRSMRYQPRLAVNYTPFPWFKNRMTMGVDMTRTEAMNLFPKNPSQWWDTGDLNSGQIGEAREHRDSYTFDYIGDITWHAAPTVRADFSIGSQIIAISTSLANATGIGLVSNIVRDIGSAARNTGGGNATATRQVGFLGQALVSFKDRLYGTLAGRFDRHSSFGRDTELFFSPRVGLSYVISDEAFWQNSRFASKVNTLRLRGAYGTTGRSPTAGSRATYQPNPYAVTSTASENGVIPQNPGNSQLKPERGEELELGFEAGLFNDLIGLQVNWFRKESKDLILRRPLPGSLGFNQNPFVNIGSVLNRGFEADLNARILTMDNFTWETRVAVSTLHNEVLDMGDIAPIGAGTSVRTTKGYPIGGYWGYQIVSHDLVNNRAIVSDTAVFLGNPPTLPGYTYQLSSTFNLLQNFSFYVGLDGVGDVMQFNSTDEFRDRQFGTGERTHRPCSTTDCPSMEGGKQEQLERFGPWFTQSGAPVGRAIADFRYREDASFLRLREVSLTYRIPRDFASRYMKSSSASLTVSSRNINMWTDYTGLDPETGNFLTAPLDRRYSARLNVQF